MASLAFSFFRSKLVPNATASSLGKDENSLQLLSLSQSRGYRLFFMVVGQRILNDLVKVHPDHSSGFRRDTRVVRGKRTGIILCPLHYYFVLFTLMVVPFCTHSALSPLQVQRINALRVVHLQAKWVCIAYRAHHDFQRWLRLIAKCETKMKMTESGRRNLSRASHVCTISAATKKRQSFHARTKEMAKQWSITYCISGSSLYSHERKHQKHNNVPL